MLVRCENVGHVVADRHVARGKRGHQQGDLKPAREGATHLKPLRQHEGHEQVDGQHDAADQADDVLSAQSARPP